MIRKIILTLLAIVTLIGLFGLFKFNKNIVPLWNANSVTVTADYPLTAEKVKVEFGVSVNSINRTNDLSLFKNRDKYIVLYDDGTKESVFNEYGENDFLITYNNQYYLSFRQFKRNRSHQHNFNFYFYQKDNKPFVKVDIKGRDAMRFERPLIEISKAANYVCNTPIDSASGIYNMIELEKKRP